MAMLLGATLCAFRAVALIFNSTGDPAFNTNAPSGVLAGSGWDWVGSFGVGSGIPIAPRHFVTAKHLGGVVGNTFVLNGTAYVTVAKTSSAAADLTVWEVSTPFPSHAPLYFRTDEVGRSAVLFGRGVTRGSEVPVGGLGEDPLRGWRWMSSSTAGTLRWGENTITEARNYPANDPYPPNGDLLVMAFDRYNGSNPNEASLGNRDSGGALFLRDPVDNAWKLAGVLVDVEAAFRTTLTGTTQFGSFFDLGGLYYDVEGDAAGGPGEDPFELAVNGAADIPGRMYAVRISSNLAWIQGITGVPPGNTAPNLNPVSNRNADLLVPVSIQLSASDADVPANTLTYSLVTGPPGMTVSTAGHLIWTPSEAQGGATHPVTVRVTDNGVPPLSDSESFSITVGAGVRSVWQIGTDDNPAVLPYTPHAEFSIQNGVNDPPPGWVTRRPGDPVYDANPAGNPGADDDFYFSGEYPQGFNGLAAMCMVPMDEPPIAWERSHTGADRSNRVHVVLSGAQTGPGTVLRFTAEFVLGGSSGAGAPPGFGSHDMVIRFRNGLGAATDLYAQTLTQKTTVTFDVLASAVGATPGANTLEIVRNGPILPGITQWIIYDFLRLEALPAGNQSPTMTPPSDRTVAELTPLLMALQASDPDVPAQALTFSLVSGPPGLTVSASGLLLWTPTETQGPGSYPVQVRVTDNGIPSLGDTRQFTVTVVEQPRTVWQIGTDDSPGAPPYNPYGEFSSQNGRNDAPPGAVTRLPGDPIHDASPGTNPGPDDDFYFTGAYPAGFNGLTSVLPVPADEPAPAWERGHTEGDRSNRVHFVLSGTQVGAGTIFRLRMEFASGGFSIGGVTQPGFGTHAMVLRFRNGAGAVTTLLSQTVTQVTTLSVEFAATAVGATVGANSIEVVRTGPVVSGTSSWIRYDYLRLEALAGGNQAPVLAQPTDRTVVALEPLTLALQAGDADLPPQALTFSLISGPPGMTASPSGLVAWTPMESQAPGAYPVTVRVTDDGIPSMGHSRQFTVNVLPNTRTVWQIGTDDSPAVSPYNPHGEFSSQNGVNDPRPGQVTREPGDPVYDANPGANPGPDDDYYFAGTYPAGFNGLSSLLPVPRTEPVWAWERGHTEGDRSNRVHLVLSSGQVTSGARFRLTAEFATGGFSSNGITQSGFGMHTMALRFRNASGTVTSLRTQTVTQATTLTVEFLASEVGAAAGANTVEVVRTGPIVSGISSWIRYDFLRLEALPPSGGFAAATTFAGRPAGGVGVLRWGASATADLTDRNPLILEGRTGQAAVDGDLYRTLTFECGNTDPLGTHTQVEASADGIRWSPTVVVELDRMLLGKRLRVTVRDTVPLAVDPERMLRARVVLDRAAAAGTAF